MNHEELRELAVRGFADGRNCAESLAAAFREHIGAGDYLIKMATPFGAGVGRRRDLCGILTAGAMVIGAVHGRVDPADAERKDLVYKLTGSYYRWFNERFGTVHCRDIVTGKFTGHTAACERIMADAVIEVARLVEGE